MSKEPQFNHISMAVSPPPPESEFVGTLRKMIASAGAEWSGIQTSFDSNRCILCFVNPQTGAPLTVEFNPMMGEFSSLFDKIEDKLRANNILSENRKITVKTSVLERIRKTVSKIESELAELLGEKNVEAGPKTNHGI